MQTCKDCVHYAVCVARTHENTLCDHFKNKADVVPVVRCKDCKHYKKINYDDVKPNTCEITTRRQHPYDFCSYGERKTNNE